MNNRWMMLVLAAGVVAGLMLSAGGCTAEDWDRFNRIGQEPDDYNKLPLGEAYDTPGEIETLNDEILRTNMKRWYDLREQYLDEWRKYGPNDARVSRIRNSVDTHHAYIRDRADQLMAMGKPLSG